MNIIDKLEKKYGHLGIPNLIRYILLISIAGNVLNLVLPNLYQQVLSFNVYAILHGQVWRLVTFLMAPSVSQGTGIFTDLIWYLIWLSLYYYVGNALEQAWGTFRFNLYYISGVVIIWMVSFASYFLWFSSMGEGNLVGTYMGMLVNTDSLNLSLFLAFAAMFPDMQFLVYFIIPVKAKWLGILDLIYMGYLLAESVMAGNYLAAGLIAGAILDFAVFYFFGRGTGRSPAFAYRQKKRRSGYKKKIEYPRDASGAMHRCAICQRTEILAPELDFRYCSKCEGDYEYCSDHLFTHEHVRRK